MSKPARVVLYAPNIHMGGGLVLLKSLLAALPKDMEVAAFVDRRATGVELDPRIDAVWVSKPSVWARVEAEIKLFAGFARSTDTVVCLHGLPPLIPLRATVFAFVQNRLLLEPRLPKQQRAATWLRICLERALFRWLARRIDAYIVQTPSMARALRESLQRARRPEPVVSVCPFVPDMVAPVASREDAVHEWDFVYAADGSRHKNHERLLDAWSVLATAGVYPRLVLTLGKDSKELLANIERRRESEGLQIHNVGAVSHAEVLRLYGCSRALIYPSLIESFGLPLLEARAHGLPVLASELDYVRDVCSPVETFDPHSAISIARAVRRFLSADDDRVTPVGAEWFWTTVRRQAS